MKNLHFGGGIAVALLLAFLSSVLLAVFSPDLSGTAFIRLLVPILVFAYLLYLNRLRSNKTGQITSLVLWCLFAMALWFLPLALQEFVLLHTLALCLLRSSYFHHRLTTTALDLCLGLFALAVAYWAMVYAGSIFLSVWCFFLVQAGFVSISSQRASKAETHKSDGAGINRFERARRKAEHALQQLATH
jgi:hypothetical protein